MLGRYKLEYAIYLFHFILIQHMVHLFLVFFLVLCIIPAMLHSQLHLNVALARRTKARSLGTFPKQCSSGNRGTLDRKVLLLSI